MAIKNEFLRNVNPGDIFSDWKVVKDLKITKGSKRRLKVQCVCGKICIRDFYSIFHGRSKSCGHNAIEKMTESKLSHAHCRRNKVSPTYRTWVGMKIRCYYKNAVNYERYGAKGIRVCDRWKDSFENFLADMGERPKGKQLDRIDSKGNYSKENCRWSTPSENSINRKTTIFCEFRGVRLPFFDLLRYFEISIPTVYNRMSKGMTRDEAIASAYYSPQRGKMRNLSPMNPGSVSAQEKS